jgi:lipid II:glycine glycyltransferase (peptidoglycan interpeptide bridge formation enzyme)
MRILHSGDASFPSPVAWDEFVSRDPRGHLLQTWAWGELKCAFGWTPMRLAIEQDGSPVAGAQILFRQLGPWTMAYIPKGPILPQQDDALVEHLWQAIHGYCRRMRAITLKVEPEWYDEEETHHLWLTRSGFRPSAECVQPRRTIVVDLQPASDEILARMKSKWRYNINLSRRKGVEVCTGSMADLDTFHQLMRITGERDRFAIHSLPYYRRAVELFEPQGRVHLFVACYEGRPLAMLLAYAFNRQSWYMYGASSNAHRDLMPNHQLQWCAMQWARGLGCLQYDLWGIPDVAEDSPTQALQGVYRFKDGFGGRVVRYVGAYDYMYAPLLNRLMTKAWALRRKMASVGD